MTVSGKLCGVALHLSVEFASIIRTTELLMKYSWACDRVYSYQESYQVDGTSGDCHHITSFQYYVFT